MKDGLRRQRPLLLFCSVLLVCLFTGLNLLYALAAGLIIFLSAGRLRGHSFGALAKMCRDGVKTAGNILIMFLLVGVLTGIWRAGGTIAVIVCYASTAMRPAIFILLTFLLNCLVSFLIGTSFGTSATMGVICLTMAQAMGVNIFWTGGAMLSGVYFGDRCSPVSTSAMLVCTLTDTDIFTNIRGMLRTALVPFLAACAVYTLVGLRGGASSSIPDLRAVFAAGFDLKWYCLLPAVLVLVLALCRVNVRLTLACGILAAVPLCIWVQGTGLPDLGRIALSGYHAADAALAAMLDGGGITSMLRVAAIVCIASCYAGLFRGTGMLDSLQELTARLSQKTTSFCASVCISVLTSALACNQTLSIMLTHQLCGEIEPKKENFALMLEDSVVVIAALIPWSIAGAVPLDTVGAPLTCMAGACFLYFLPLWRLAISFIRKRGTA